ncbi:hypothetical protein bAD24_p00635 (plasmid) [Burkholderia sp. AD24]|nr:hypothetical protein bAD24_p00635 [Burkholderia sp. AD24]
MTSLDPPTVQRDGEPIAGSSLTKSDAWHQEGWFTPSAEGHSFNNNW